MADSLEIVAIRLAGWNENVEEETANYERAFANPLKAAERGYVDDIIEPSETRERIVNALKVLDTKDRP